MNDCVCDMIYTKHTSHSLNTRWTKLLYGAPQGRTGWRWGGGSSSSISAAPYLVLLGDVLLVILLHLPELGLQPTQLDLHLLHILQVPLGPLVQHLNGLGHVLDLRRWTEASDGVTKGVSDIRSRGFKKHPFPSQLSSPTSRGFGHMAEGKLLRHLFFLRDRYNPQTPQSWHPLYLCLH